MIDYTIGFSYINDKCMECKHGELCTECPIHIIRIALLQAKETQDKENNDDKTRNTR